MDPKSEAVALEVKAALEQPMATVWLHSMFSVAALEDTISLTAISTSPSSCEIPPHR